MAKDRKNRPHTADINSRTRRIIDSRHPNFLADIEDWKKWRLTYEGGRQYVHTYLKKFTNKEDNKTFQNRRDMTPIPSFASAAVNDIRNSIFQRLRDVIRRDGSDSYKRAIQGLDLGVDLRGSTMNAFMGMDVLTELLIMGRVGIYVDNPIVFRQDGRLPSLADTQGIRPYLYKYQVEDILSWRCAHPESPSEFQSLLLRDTCTDFDTDTLLPLTSFERFRWLWINPETGNVNMHFIDGDGNTIDRNGQLSTDPIELNLKRIPFVMPNIGGSVLTDVCQHQIALLNLVSSDVSYALKANFPFYTEQRDLRGVGDHLKHNVAPDGTSESGGQHSHLREFNVGPTQGRAYDIKAERPGFIHPSSEPLKASMSLQEKLEGDIRKLINLAVQSMATRASAESKSLDNQGLEAGLSFIGLVLESAERRIADLWAAYESVDERKRQIAIIKYPDRYSLKDDAERVKEARELAELIQNTPSKTARKEMWKNLVAILLSGRVSVEKIDAINTEIDNANFTTSDPDIIIRAVEAGLSGEETASLALGFAKGEVEKAREDQARRIERIQAAQTPRDQQKGFTKPGEAAARGLPDLDIDPQAAKQEKAESRNPDLQFNRKRRVRGKGKQRVVQE
jgi:hypothetical protein